jgi:DNA-directed RNA polymerase subunit beta'
MIGSVGHLLLNEILPTNYQITGPITNKQLHDKLVTLAKEHPQEYVRVISQLKRRGDEIATLEGISVGLDDISPDYQKRDMIVNAVANKIKNIKDPTELQKTVVDAQNELLALTKEHPGSMTHMALSGARGNPAQLMKIVTTPLAANSEKKGVNPFLIRRSYSEGLTPAEYWITTPEARANAVASVVSIAKPGEMNKVLIANMITKVITQPDCGTHSGIHLKVDDPNCLDRYTAENQQGIIRNTLVTPQVIQVAKQHHISDLFVRSPMTCAAVNGVCQKCMGLNEKGQTHSIGINVGVRSAQAMTEPLTQMALSSKHSVLTIKEKKPELVGFKGVRQLLEVPKVFQHEALLAEQNGTIGLIEAAPQGGHYIHFGKEKLYAAPDLTVLVKPGQIVEIGDALTNGVPHPGKVIQLKGLGAGRQYFVNALHKVYANEGVNLDKRHFELLAKTNLNHVRLLEHDPDHPELLKGDPISYNVFRDTYAKDTVRKSINEAIGDRLGEDIYHHTVGTPITTQLIQELKARGVTEIQVTKRMPKVEFIMRNFAMNPRQDPDWLGRASHRYLKGSFQQAAQIGEEADIHGYHPIAAYAYGAEIRQGPHGEY